MSIVNDIVQPIVQPIASDIFGNPTNGLLNGLVAHWALNEPSGVRSDSYGSFDMADPTSIPSVEGIRGLCADVTQSNNEYFENLTPMISAGGTLAMGGWFKVASNATNKVVTFGDVTSELLVRSNNGKLEVILNSFSSNDRVACVNNIPTNEWVHYVAQFDGSDIEIYMNGAFENSVTPTGSHTAAGVERIGRYGTASHDGQLALMSLWNRGLTAQEIAYHYNEGRGLDLDKFTS